VDKEGITKYSTEIMGQQMRFVGGRTEPKPETAQQSTANSGTQAKMDLPEETDDLPF
jgi:single-stranded DNA-binding protein